MENERRLRAIIRSAEPNNGRAFAHWFGNGWFVLIRKTRAELHWSATYSSEPEKSKLIYKGPRNGETYSQMARALGW